MRWLVLFSFFLLPLSSCNQNGLAIKESIKNAVTLPYKAVSGYFSDREYEKVAAAGLDFESVDCDGAECRGPKETPLKEVLGIEKVSEAIRESACQCRSWGSCRADTCQCSRLCPNSFEIFKRENIDQIKDLTKRENSLAFRNALGGSKYEATQGYCWGHASVTSQFNRLAFFKGKSKAPYDLKSDDYDEQLKAIEFYKEKVDQIVANQATDIPGFDNLHDFSDHPALQSYIADVVAESWAKNAMSFQGLMSVTSSRPSKRKVNEATFEKIKEKIDNHQQPQIVFNEENNARRAHAVLISHYEISDKGDLILCVRDNNYRPQRNAQCAHKMYLGEDGHIRYGPWGNIGKVKLAHNDNAAAIKQFKALKERCAAQYGCD